VSKKVQLLVSDSDVESYKQIKADLDGLRLLVEKSELWVYKAKMATAEDEVGSPGINGGGGDEKTVAIKKEPLDILDEEGQGQPDSLLMSLDNNNSIIQHHPLPPNKKPAVRGPMLSSSDKQGSAIDLDIGPPLDESQAINYKQIQQILARMNRLCVQPILSTTSSVGSGGGSGSGGSVSGSGGGSLGGGLRPRKHEQRLLRNMGVHTVVLDLLQIPYDRKEDVRMNELMRLAHEFLQNFCRGNQPNQALLHKHLELFLTPGVNSFYILALMFFKLDYFVISVAGSSNGLCHLSRQCPIVQRTERQSGPAFRSLHRDSRPSRRISPLSADDRESGRTIHPQVPRHGHARTS
jgi:inositol 1,4,5-triphosphate receptor type 1